MRGLGFLAGALMAWAGLATAADICHAVSMRQFAHGTNGSPTLALATRLNPLDMGARFSQIETLFKSWQHGGEMKDRRGQQDLDEAVLIANGILHDFPGNAQAKMAYATTLSVAGAHQAYNRAGAYSTISAEPLIAAADAAMAADPTSVAMIERAMFNLTVYRTDYKRFLALGIKRAGLTHAPLKMRCDLCGKEWTDHGKP